MPQVKEIHKLPTQICEITAGDGCVLMILILHATKHYNTHMRAHLLSETVQHHYTNVAEIVLLKHFYLHTFGTC